MKKNYKGANVFNYLKDLERLKKIVKKQNPTFRFSSDKGDVAEAYVKDVFGLKNARYGMPGYDLLTKNGLKVSVKNVWEINQYRGVHFQGMSQIKIHICYLIILFVLGEMIMEELKFFIMDQQNVLKNSSKEVPIHQELS